VPGGEHLTAERVKRKQGNYWLKVREGRNNSEGIFKEGVGQEKGKKRKRGDGTVEKF